MNAFRNDKVNASFEVLNESLLSLQDTMASLYNRSNPSSNSSVQDAHFGFNLEQIMEDYHNIEEKLILLGKQMTSDQFNDSSTGELIYPRKLDSSGKIFNYLPRYLQSGSLGPMMTEEEEILSGVNKRINTRDTSDQQNDEDKEDKEANEDMNDGENFNKIDRNLSDDIYDVNCKIDGIIKKYQSEVDDRKKKARYSLHLHQKEKRVRNEEKEIQNNKKIQLQAICQILFDKRN